MTLDVSSSLSGTPKNHSMYTKWIVSTFGSVDWGGNKCIVLSSIFNTMYESLSWIIGPFYLLVEKTLVGKFSGQFLLIAYLQKSEQWGG